MKQFRFLRLIFCLYDTARLIVIVGIITQLGKLSLYDGSYPYLVYASAQALFPVMTCFVYFDAEKYLAYFPLNIMGKCINILLSGIWVFHAVSGFLAAMSFDFFVCLGLTLIIMFTDIISILGMVFVKKGFSGSFQKHDDIHQHNLEHGPEADQNIGGI